MFFLSLYLQQVLGESALRPGVSLLPMVSVISIGVLASQRLILKIGPRRLVLGGGLVTIAFTVTHHSHASGLVAAGYRVALLVVSAVSVVTALISFFLKGARTPRPQQRDKATADIG
ncbi:MAG: hypothetical protein ACRDP6_11200 [Actinoallomurus sp.]